MTGDKITVDLRTTKGCKQEIKIIFPPYKLWWFLLVCFATTWQSCYHWNDFQLQCAWLCDLQNPNPRDKLNPRGKPGMFVRFLCSQASYKAVEAETLVPGLLCNNAAAFRLLLLLNLLLWVGHKFWCGEAGLHPTARSHAQKHGLGWKASQPK